MNRIIQMLFGYRKVPALVPVVHHSARRKEITIEESIKRYERLL